MQVIHLLVRYPCNVWEFERDDWVVEDLAEREEMGLKVKWHMGGGPSSMVLNEHQRDINPWIIGLRNSCMDQTVEIPLVYI